MRNKYNKITTSKFTTIQINHILNKPTKLQRGMYYTIYRNKGYGNTHFGRTKTLNSLLARGTTDKLGNFWLYKQKTTCLCCGSKNKGLLKISEKGRSRLIRLKLKRGIV